MNGTQPWRARSFLKGTHSEIVRCVLWDDSVSVCFARDSVALVSLRHEIVVTGGEDGRIAAWRCPPVVEVEDDPMDGGGLDSEDDKMRSPPPPNSTPTFQRKRMTRDDSDDEGGVRLFHFVFGTETLNVSVQKGPSMMLASAAVASRASMKLCDPKNERMNYCSTGGIIDMYRVCSPGATDIATLRSAGGCQSIYLFQKETQARLSAGGKWWLLSCALLCASTAASAAMAMQRL